MFSLYVVVMLLLLLLGVVFFFFNRDYYNAFTDHLTIIFTTSLKLRIIKLVITIHFLKGGLVKKHDLILCCHFPCFLLLFFFVLLLFCSLLPVCWFQGKIKLRIV